MGSNPAITYSDFFEEVSVTTELEIEDDLGLIEADIFVSDPFPYVPVIHWWKFSENVPDYFGDVPDDWCDYWVGRTGDLDKPSKEPKPIGCNRKLCKKCFRGFRETDNDLCPECTHTARKKEVLAQEVRTVCSTCMVNVPEKGKTCNDCKADVKKARDKRLAKKAAKKAARLSN